MKTGGRFSLEHPLAPQFDLSPEVGFVGEEYPGSDPLGFLPQGGILCHEGFPLRLTGLDQAFLRTLEAESHAMQVVQATLGRLKLNPMRCK